MPMIVLAIRMELELIFKNSYKVFFSHPIHEAIAMKLINDVITELIDPNLYYSQFSFFGSGREAINMKQQLAKGAPPGGKSFFTRSALVQQLVPCPAEGHVRAMFKTGKCSSNEVTRRLI